MTDCRAGCATDTKLHRWRLDWAIDIELDGQPLPEWAQQVFDAEAPAIAAWKAQRDAGQVDS
jgi:hypothetical protein